MSGWDTPSRPTWDPQDGPEDSTQAFPAPDGSGADDRWSQPVGPGSAGAGPGRPTARTSAAPISVLPDFGGVNQSGADLGGSDVSRADLARCRRPTAGRAGRLPARPNGFLPDRNGFPPEPNGFPPDGRTGPRTERLPAGPQRLRAGPGRPAAARPVIASAVGLLHPGVRSAAARYPGVRAAAARCDPGRPSAARDGAGTGPGPRPPPGTSRRGRAPPARNLPARSPPAPVSTAAPASTAARATTAAPARTAGPPTSAAWTLAGPTSTARRRPGPGIPPS